MRYARTHQRAVRLAGHAEIPDKAGNEQFLRASFRESGNRYSSAMQSLETSCSSLNRIISRRRQPEPVAHSLTADRTGQARSTLATWKLYGRNFAVQ